MSQTDDRDVLTQNRVFDLLSNARRRFVLHFLSQQEGPVELRELADAVARWETGQDSLSRKQRKRVYVSLYQTHIPRLSDAGVIEYDSETGLVRLVDRARDIDQYINIPEEEPPWPLFYLAIAIAGLLFNLLGLLGVIPGVSGQLTGLTVVGILLVVSVTHFVVNRRRRKFQISADRFVRRDE